MHANKATKGELYKPDYAFCEEVKFSVKMAIYLFHQLDESDIAFLEEKRKELSGYEMIYKEKSQTHVDPENQDQEK
jgi:hypothetical protein